MTLWLIIGGIVIGVPAIATCIWLWRSRDKAVSARHAAPRNFRPEAATPVTLPLRLPEVRRHRDVVAAAWGRPWIYNDLPGPDPAPNGGLRVTQSGRRAGEPDRLAVMAAEFVPPEDLPGDRETPAASPQPRLEASRGHLLAGELAPHVVAALTAAGAEDTVVRMSDLEPMVGGDVYDGLGQEEWLNRMFPRPKAITWSAA